MKPLNRVTKKKERQVIILDSFKEIDDLKISSLVPKEAKKVEINCKPSRQNQKYILEIDYILSLEIRELKMEEIKNGRTEQKRN